MIDLDSPELVEFQNKIDSLKKEALEKRKPKKYTFNPNYITDFKGYQLGMTTKEIDRLHAYRKLNKFVNSIKEFQKITKVSDTLLSKMSPLFKFPDWVNKRDKLKKQSNSSVVANKVSDVVENSYKPLTANINEANQQDFEAVSGVGEVISERIVKYRRKLQGFSYESQVYEVWGVEKITVKRILKTFKVYKKPKIKKVNINTITFKELLKNPYIDYDLCKDILEYRDEIAEFQDILELKNIDSFPIKKYDRIVLYLKAE
ncbi:ComEA family DNA-binding protein [Tenacibaculum ovolyticum]|uniref:ComEA family DNA-binding protein n=1 Tax=Tenacibaculum ovolyticum TaxID=104270 RepID=UPI0004048DD2|nr:helix-hairpin-helix domain-containing protein [Tenacibaculum ovolyticum]